MNHKYVIVENFGKTYSVMLTDFAYWANVNDQLEKYCKDNKLMFQGILVAGLREQDVMMFKLAWGEN